MFSCLRRGAAVRSTLLGAAVLLLRLDSAWGQASLSFERFDADPGWAGTNHRPHPAVGVMKAQDFGYSAARHASVGPGEVGGTVSRSLVPASYLKPVEPRSLENRLHAEGRLAVTGSSGGSVVLIGWFNHASRGWRTPNSLAIRFDGADFDRFCSDRRLSGDRGPPGRCGRRGRHRGTAGCPTARSRSSPPT